MKILLVYPDYEETFWSFKKVLKILGKKASYPPLGLINCRSHASQTAGRKNWLI